MKFRPLGDRVVVRRIKEDQKTAGGIIIPDTVAEKPQEGEIISVGPGAIDEKTGKRTLLEVKAGDYRAVRQMVGHRSEARRRRTPDHEGERRDGRAGRQEGSRSKPPRPLTVPHKIQTQNSGELIQWQPKT